MRIKYPYCYVFYYEYKVYSLVDFFGNVFYVGITRRSLEERLKQHISYCYKKTAIGKKKDVVIRSGYKISIHQLDKLVVSSSILGIKRESMAAAFNKEKEWISELSKVYELTNLLHQKPNCNS